MPGGNYDIALYGSGVTGLIPGLCSILCTKAIPTEANGSTGNNTSFYSNPEADKLMLEVDNNLDDDVRKESAKKADKILAEDMVALPLDPLCSGISKSGDSRSNVGPMAGGRPVVSSSEPDGTAAC